MKKTSLERKILKEVYSFEKKRTLLTVVKYILFAGIAGFCAFQIFHRLSWVLGHQVNDVISLYRHDSDIVINNYNDIISTLYEEAPKELLLFLGAALVLLFICIIFFILNFRKIKNRIVSFMKRG